MEFLKVSSKSSPASVAGAIAGMVKDGVPCQMQAVGAGAVNQAIKAVAIARGFLIPTGTDISCAPTFADIEIGGQSRTAVRIAIYVHPITLGGSSQSVPVVMHSDDYGVDL
ncbi:stage V sporulation protein S [Atopobium sp. oral taxon 810]|uniref:stage V sporulation protein S n=1 Tax=Atopobium sp. oral taxon 810 TaxID=712158 RepID=UPI000396D037|nr:stage V sporulation protein S [Atopobium sp. oral taxon 810]ERI03872.1 putative stage V sporulation protein S [Atopobium sp. oral taxon 810 str. F0209]